MKKTILFIAALIVLALVALRVPDIQDQLLQRTISSRMENSPDHLFIDDALRIVICGSAAPMPIKGRAAACVMVIAGGKYYIVDTGNRSTNNLGLWGIPANRVGGVFLTHYHSDHIGDLGEFNMITWAQGRTAPLQITGPKGLRQVVDGFTQAYQLDSNYRTAHHGVDLLNPDVGRMLANEISFEGEQTPVLDDGKLKVTMFRVDHEPINPAVGYRFDYKGRSVVISGDTIQSATLTKVANGADVLVHEALARNIVKQMEYTAGELGNERIKTIMFDIQDYHASPVEAAQTANAANVKELVLYHLVPAPVNQLAEQIFMRGVSDIREEGVTLGFDGLLLELPIGSTDVIKSNVK